MGHQCPKEKPIVVKQWKPVAKNPTMALKVRTTNNPIESTYDAWIVMANNRKLKGKNVL